ncbi:nuclear transport factor 2 family protein [Bacteroidota bacterium]
MKLLHFIVITIIASLFFTTCQNTEKEVIDKDAEISLITEAIHNTIGWAKTKDIDLLYNIIANDSNFVEIHPSPRVVFGIENFKKAEAFWMDPRFKAIGFEIRNLKITLSRSGDVAWFYCMLDDMNEWDGEPANWMNARWTGVLEKRNSSWRMVQQHFSYASDE